MRDDADGARVAGHRLIRGLVGIHESKK